MQSSKTVYDIPKSSITLFKAENVLEIPLFVSALLRGSKLCVIHHECMESWLKECYADFNSPEFHSFSSEKQIVSDDIRSFESTDIVFVDFDIYIDAHGNHKSFSLLNELKRAGKVYLASSLDTQTLFRIESFATAVLSIRRQFDSGCFQCMLQFVERNGKCTTSSHEAIPILNQKMIFKPICKAEADDTHLTTEFNIENNTVRSPVDLPYFASRQEDGVAIRDAAKKRIRVGGQIVYEPDCGDDLDDSDPDDDLHI